MSVDAIISRIREEAEKEVQAIRAEESCDISNIHAHADQKAEDLYNRRMAEGQREIRQYLASQQSRTRIDAKRKVRAVQEDIINRCFSEVTKHLRIIRNRDEYPIIFKFLLKECAENLGSSEILVQVHQKDRFLAEECIRELNQEGFSLRLSEQLIQTDGGVICVRVSDKVMIDNTLETRFTRMERELIVAASHILFQSGE